MDTIDALPPEVRAAFQRVCRTWTLANYIGDCVRIYPKWQDLGRYGFIRIFSTQIGLPARQGLLELRRLVKAGLLIEDERACCQMRVFTLADKDLEQRMLREAYDHWASLGYSTDKITPKRH